jgi:hypothetical protein
VTTINVPLSVLERERDKTLSQLNRCSDPEKRQAIAEELEVVVRLIAAQNKPTVDQLEGA